MKQDISSLMDGEVEAHEADRIIRACGASEEHKDTWQLYHVIGEAIRGQSPRSLARDNRVVEAIANEPTIIGGRKKPFETFIGKVALAAAASVATVGVVSWIGTQGGAPGVSTTPIVAKGATASAIKPVSATAKVVPAQPLPDVQDYLSAHRQVPSPDAYKAVANQRGAAAAR